MERQESKCVRYRAGFKYIMYEDTWIYTGIKLDEDFITDWVHHYRDGWMRGLAGFGFDGPSGVTIDDRCNMRGACFHDQGYYLLRHGFPQKYRVVFDLLLEKTMEQDAEVVYKDKRFANFRRWFQTKVRPSYYEYAVEKFGGSAADPKNIRPILIAP